MYLQSEIGGFRGSPEGKIKAPPGQLIVDEVTGDVYRKTTSTDLATGWDRMAGASDLVGLGGGALVETIKTTGFTLAAGDNGKRFVATAAITITLPAVGTLGNGFEVEVLNDSGGSVVIDGPGSTNVTLADKEIACILEANSKQWVVLGSATVIS